MSTDTNPRRPYARPNDRWQCTADPQSPCGGTRIHGEDVAECTPRPSLRLQRGIFTSACTALIIGILFACWNRPVRHQFIAPGPLSGAHAQILAHQGNDRCQVCHGAGDRTLGDWIQDAVTSGRHIPVSQSQLCMDCHDQHLVSEFSLHAHNVDPARLNELTQVARNSHWGRLGTTADPGNLKGEIACSACHREHQGGQFDLTRLTDRQCQTCHVRHIHRFEKDHPEFSSWPFSQRTGIAFDHVSHANQHFASKNESFNCQACHVDDEQGIVKKVAPFEVSCARCHQEDIVGPANPRWTFFELPMLDVQALTAENLTVGQWPSANTGDFDGSLPPAMKVLLMADPEAAAILRRRGRNFQFSDLDPVQTRDLRDALQLARSIKRLLWDLSVSGQDEIDRRLQKAAGHSVSKEFRPSYFATGLNASVFEEAWRAWMPELGREMRCREAEQKVNAQSISFRTRQEEEEELLADNPLAGLMRRGEVSAESPGEQSAEASSSLPSLQLPEEPLDDASASDAFADGELQSAVSDEDWLAQNPLSDLWSRPIEHNQLPPVKPPTQPPKEMLDESTVRQTIIRMASADHGGWIRDDRTFSISYRPGYHADPVLKSWIDFALENADKPTIQSSGIVEAMNSPQATGQCRRCHTAEHQPDGTIAVQWNPNYRDVRVRGFTRFSHRPHNVLNAQIDCQHCHQMDPSLANADTFQALDSSAYRSNFAPLQVADCAHCHRKNGAPTGCVDCHHYHVGSRKSMRPSPTGPQPLTKE